jgi:hypothetical protein
MTSPAQAGTDQAMVPDNDHNAPPAFSVNPAGVIMAGDPAPPAHAVSQQPGAGPATATARPDTGTGGVAGWPPAGLTPSAEPAPAAPSAVADAGTSPRARWNEIQAMFVDDPRSSAESAAVLVDDCVQALVASVREQQDSLLAAWHGENAGTEELRAAVQHYHAFGNRLADFTHET